MVIWMPDYLALARRAPTDALRRRYLARHKAQKVRDTIKGCRACGLGIQRTKAVPWSGPIAGNAELVLVGEAPGATEDKHGEPFIGDAGRMLDKCLKAAHGDRSRVAILNTICCRPPKNRDPEPSEMTACQPNFEAQLNIIGVGMGVALGVSAAAAVLGVSSNTIRMVDVRGEVAWRYNMVWTFTYHPAYILRNRNEAGLLTGDLRVALDVARGLDDLPLNISTIPPADIDRPLGPGIHDHIRRKKYATVKLHKIGQTIIVVANEKGKYTVPHKAGDFPIYTLSELIKLGVISRQWEMTSADMRRLHEAKVALGGTLIA